MRRCAIILLFLTITPPEAHSETRIRDLMTPAQFRTAGLHKLSAAELRILDRWFASACSDIGSGSLAEPAARTRDFADLLGASLIASDGTFLGKISRSTLDGDSISNTMSPHGSTLGADSIFSTLGQYGSTLSSLSPFNSLASAPPRIVKDGRQLGYLTKNSIKQPAIDPDELLKWLNPDRDYR